MTFKEAHSTNFRKGRTQQIEYLVIHFTSNDNDTVQGNLDYYARTKNLQASAHFYVDRNGVGQSVREGDTAYHCGAYSYKHPKCRNSNSIGIELCSRYTGNIQKDKKNNTVNFNQYYFEEAVIKNAVELTKELMAKYNIPEEKVIRHFDVTGKTCPAPFVIYEKQWQDFKRRLKAIKKLESINDIAWELGNRGIAKELPYWMKRMEEDQNIYWLCNKIVNYILYYCRPQHGGQQLETQNDVLWELNHRGIISNTKLWKSKFALEPYNTFILAKNAANYILTH